MNILYTQNKKQYIAYNKSNVSKKKAPYIIFHHGLMSDMKGSKALYIEKFCRDQDYNFIRFDNFGHGHSSGQFAEQTITRWCEGLDLIVDKLTDEPILLIGSSMGAWVTLLNAIKFPKKIIGIICISAAPDFTEELIWNKLTKEQQEILNTQQIIDVMGDNKDCNYTYPISNQLIIDGRKNLLLNKQQIDISCPVHLIHGMDDRDVPYNISMRLAEKIITKKLTLKLIKDANHSLSRDKDLQIICNSIEEILK